MKKVSAIFLVFLILSISNSNEKELLTTHNNMMKDKISPALIQNTINKAAESIINKLNTSSNQSNQENQNLYTSNKRDETSNNSKSNTNKDSTSSNNSINNSKNDSGNNNNKIKSNLNSHNQNENNSKPNDITDDDEYSYDKNIECNEKNCFYPNGRCINNTTCGCTREYASFKVDGEVSDHYCAYERKKQLVSFMLEFFFPFGVGHFYSGRVLIGILKLIVCFSQCIFAGLGVCFAKDAGMVLVILLLIFGCVYIVWELVDIILIALNIYKDGNGVPLARW